MNKIENQMLNQLIKLKNEFQLKGIKAEYEAEGSSFNDLVRLRRITSNVDTKLYLKIGGVEAIRDIRDAREIGVDGIIAPMVESAFGAKKFYDSIKKIYKDQKINTTINIETKNSIDQIDDILDFAEGKFDSVTLGRTDLSFSYFNEKIKPDSKFIFDLLEKISLKVKKKALSFTVGGSISINTIKMLSSEFLQLKDTIDKLETRKIMLPTSVFIDQENSINEALKFEKLYILSKKEFIDLQIESEISRLEELKNRLS